MAWNRKHISAWQQGHDDGEGSQAPTSGTRLEGAPKHSVIKTSSILMQYFKKSKLMQKSMINKLSQF